MTGAGLSNLDATLVRGFHLGEKASLQFRGEVFDLVNHPNYNLIGRIVNDPTFGIVQNFSLPHDSCNSVSSSATKSVTSEVR